MAGQLPGTSEQRKGLSVTAKTTLISGLASAALLVALIIFVVTQFGPKPVETINWQSYTPTLNTYPGATLIASNSELNPAYKHSWRIYASAEDLGKVKQFYQDQFLGLGYKQDSGNSAFSLNFYREESNRCQSVRYGLDVLSLDENTIDLPDVNVTDLKVRYRGQNLFVLHQLDIITNQPTC